ncbi:MAG: DUF3037 domain-containing protein [Candidatus Dormibacteria bacterium]
MDRGFYSVVRWRPNATRDEARNVAVVLVDAEGQFGGVRVAPPSSLSQDVRQQGFLDAILHGLESQFGEAHRPDLRQLRELSETLSQSLYLTSPRATAVADPDLTLQALYKSLVAPLPRPRSLTKGVITDEVVRALRRRGWHVRRGEYLGDFVFDAVIDRPEGVLVCDVLSFATIRKDGIPAERDAGHFLYGIGRLNLPGIAVIQAPSGSTGDEVQTSYERVKQWFEGASVTVHSPEEFGMTQMSLSLV